MIKILTAIGNQNMNDRLKEEKDFEILENDIFYKEGVLEFLEENKNVDIIILYEKLYGEIEIIDLVKKIKIINSDIDIFFILESKNSSLENLLKEEKVKNIFYNDEINFEDFISNLKNIETNDEENLKDEILRLKNIINQKDEEIKKCKIPNYENKEIKEEKTKTKIITIIGEKNAGKTVILNNINNFLNNKNKIEFKEINSHNFTEIERINLLSYKIIYIVEINLEKIKMNKKILNMLISENKISAKKVNIIFNKIDKYSINKKIAKNIFKDFKIIGNIKNSCYYDFKSNEKNNLKNENKKLKKMYLKIIKKLKI